MTDDIALFLLVMARVSVFVAFFPLFTKRQLPAQVKVGLAASLSIFWLADAKSVIPATELTDIGGWIFTFLLVKEVFTGMLLSLLLGLFFWPAKIAGSYIAQELGLSLASISDPSSQDSSTLVSRVFESFSILVFFALNLHHFIILTLHFSFHYVLTRVGMMTLPTEAIIAAFSNSDDYGLLIIAPVLVMLMMVTLVLAFLNRAAPSLNLFSVGMPLRVGFGVLLLFVFSPIIFGAMQMYLFRVQEDIESILSLLAG
ncbi:flagellar biosynthetic protein FliR [Roseiconus lacunae]|uniref:Flagellar biosynthetic protein FliR n=1 Tax=Roseiconus lacunae TaxID=2605694 RepID=A0ABT7PE02_9BACT|nr:flagellar biosynthetic protein FliR [Roseiconus lacunae]MCD0459811.1 flagellar biosynthetic protein FliR [Roseiconus lacunae]MDM4014509.1 flagellar biosynthetic protein FliR [Roseiconus lacunae]WRQ49822.1 flagellar biosynthetic protein FliR [Stieleria sp. HD01]